ncbi:MAG: hypothetical protein IJ544_00360 [Prevotella sp.]|nr:hypothetical protein [Prevotella sp.]
MNIEVMEQLLKDLAANVGYELIPNPFDTPFDMESLKVLPDAHKIIWPVDEFVLNSTDTKDLRERFVNADFIDSIVLLSHTWPIEMNVVPSHIIDEDITPIERLVTETQTFFQEHHIVMLLIDTTRSRRGCIKFVNAQAWDLSKQEDIPAVCNLIVHDLFPGEQLLAYPMDVNLSDELEELWEESVAISSAFHVHSWLPSAYIPKGGRKRSYLSNLVDDLGVYLSSVKQLMEQGVDAKIVRQIEYCQNCVESLDSMLHSKN